MSRPEEVDIATLSKESQENEALCIVLAEILEDFDVSPLNIGEELFFDLDKYATREIQIAALAAFNRLQTEGKIPYGVIDEA